MRIYLASAYESRDHIRDCADELTRIGFTVTSTWLEEKHEINDGTTGAATDLPAEQVDKHAMDDLYDISQSDMLVLFTEGATGHRGGGGRHVETGYALSLGLPVLVVGEPENVFHRLREGVTVVSDWHDAVIELSRRFIDKSQGEYRTTDAAVSAR